MEKRARVIGAGLAGSEAAWQLAERGVEVDLYEMRGVKATGIHHTTDFAELVCSNSLGARALTGASGLMKREMAMLGSIVVEAAEAHAVPAGGALAVDREGFARAVTERLSHHPRIHLHREEVGSLEGDMPTVLATGPLTSEAMAATLQSMAGSESLFFFDAAAPILTLESVDQSIAFRGARMGFGRQAAPEGEGDYLNCPMNKEEYEAFWHALVAGENAVLHLEADQRFFESCLPVEVIARRGIDTLRYGPMKPLGLKDPRTGRRPWAVVQLRQDNAVGTLYNMVGFQTQLKWGEQARIFRLIPGLAQADFVRYGVMHRNTYLNSPRLLEPSLQWRDRPNLFLAGQMIGVEGYADSAAMGILAGLNLARRLSGQPPLRLPAESMLGALVRYVTTPGVRDFQPMNANWGILPPLENPPRDKHEKRRLLAERALSRLDGYLKEEGLGLPAGV